MDLLLTIIFSYPVLVVVGVILCVLCCVMLIKKMIKIAVVLFVAMVLVIIFGIKIGVIDKGKAESVQESAHKLVKDKLKDTMNK